MALWYRSEPDAGVAQLARACACQAQGRRFDPDHPLQGFRPLIVSLAPQDTRNMALADRARGDRQAFPTPRPCGRPRELARQELMRGGLGFVRLSAVGRHWRRGVRRRDARRLALRDEPARGIQKVRAHSFRIDVERVADVVEREWPARIPPAHPDLGPSRQHEAISRSPTWASRQAPDGVHQYRETQRALTREPTKGIVEVRVEDGVNGSTYAGQPVRV